MQPTTYPQLLHHPKKHDQPFANEEQSTHGDKAFDIDWIRAELNDRRALAVTPPRANRKHPTPCDLVMYCWCHLVENFFCNLHEIRRIAAHYDKTDISFSAMIHLAGFHLALK